MSPLNVPFGDLSRQHATLRPELEAVFSRILASGWYILGTEVSAFEQEFATACGAKYAVGVASGADALYLSLAALDIGAGDEVITVANAGAYQVAAIAQTGAQPVLVDIDPASHNIDPLALEDAITSRTQAILLVHLYGRMCNMPAIAAIAAKYGLTVVEDAAQAHGAWVLNALGEPQGAGSGGTCACFSFYPTKNLGAMGDGGAIVTNDASLVERVRSLRQYGWSSKYVIGENNGRNSRLDELQAAILRVKLRYLDIWNAARRERAAWYDTLLADTPLELPRDEPGHVYHLYVVTTDNRDTLQHHLATHRIGCAIHYPVPAHLQPAYRNMSMVRHPQQATALPHTERQAQRVLSLPLYPELTRAEVERVTAAIRAWARR
jgi:dTDP-4-amino-4,6-dideoxygalactose transaminase